MSVPSLTAEAAGQAMQAEAGAAEAASVGLEMPSRAAGPSRRSL